MNKNYKNTSQENFLAKWLEGEITNAELKDQVSEDNYINYLKIKKGLAVIDELNMPMDDTLLKIKKKIAKKPKIITLYKKYAILVAASFILFFGLSQFFKNSDVQINTSFGEQKTIALLDGSEVILNAKSEIKYNKTTWKNKRELYLDGEAYFKVTKGSKFTVKTKNGKVTVLGTQFNVNSKDNYFNVICYEGKVKVTENNSTHILTFGKGITTINGNQRDLELGDKFPKWTIGESTFNNESLKFVMDELENQFNIIFDRTAINESINFTGSFNNKDLKMALATVFKPMKIDYKKTNNKIILSAKN